MAVERRSKDIVRRFDRQSGIMPQVRWFADADRGGELLRFARLAPTERSSKSGVARESP